MAMVLGQDYLVKKIVKTAHQGGRVSPLDHGLYVRHKKDYSRPGAALMYFDRRPNIPYVTDNYVFCEFSYDSTTIHICIYKYL